MPARILLIAGEPSGDAYAAALAKTLWSQDPTCEISGIGGGRLRSAGVSTLIDVEGKAVMGLLPVLARLPSLMRLLKSAVEKSAAFSPQTVVTIDYPGFNLRCIDRLRKRLPQCRFVHVVAPQVWAWKPRRAKKIAHRVDVLCCFFPFEPPYFTRHGGDARFVGHPMLDLIQADTCQGIHRTSDLLLLAPGSRAKELEHLLPIMDQAAKQVEKTLKNRGISVHCAIARCPELPEDLYRRHSNFPFFPGTYRQACRSAHLACITSGTATLEAALLGLPHVLCYATDPLTYRLARYLIRCPYIGLPNLVAGQEIVPELIQSGFTPQRLASELIRRWDGSERTKMQEHLNELATKLGGGGALEHMAQVILESKHGKPK
jgi:lipid-A-disaccharide synthase